MPIPNVAEFAFGRLLSPEQQPERLSLTDEGHLLVSVAGETMTRMDALLLCTENLRLRPLNRRMQGRNVPEVFRRLVAAAGEGYLLLSREDEQFHLLQLQKDLCFFREGVLWALDSTLMWDVGSLPGSRGSHPISLVRAAGDGLVAIRVSGELVAVKIGQERPHRIHEDGFVGWVGNVVPTREPDTPFLYCEGEGAVFVSLPRGAAERPAASVPA